MADSPPVIITRTSHHESFAMSGAGYNDIYVMTGPPPARPDYWRDRFGGRPLLIWTGFLGLGLAQVRRTPS